jgi:hypothetical protein
LIIRCQRNLAETIGAAVMITVASILLCHLLLPRSASGSRCHRHKAALNRRRNALHHAPVIDVPANGQRAALPFATRFADHTRYRRLSNH